MRELIKLDRNIAPFAGMSIEIPCNWTKEFYESILSKNKFCLLNGTKVVLVDGHPKVLAPYPSIESVRFVPYHSYDSLSGQKGDIIYLTDESMLASTSIHIGKIF